MAAEIENERVGRLRTTDEPTIEFLLDRGLGGVSSKEAANFGLFAAPVAKDDIYKLLSVFDSSKSSDAGIVVLVDADDKCLKG